MAEADTTYSVYFTGRWLSKPATGTQQDLLRTLFPHADAERLSHFLDRRRVLLIHGEPLEEAERIVRTLLAHGLDCEIVEDAGSPLDVAAAMKPPPAPHPPPQSGPAAVHAAAQVTHTAHTAHTAHTEAVHHEGDEEFTPVGRRILRVLIVVVAVGVLVASWSAWRRLQRGPAADLAAMPATCATDTLATWYGRTTGHRLVCAAKTGAGARYVLRFDCDRDGSLRTALAFQDPAGAPREPAWPAARPGSILSVRYAVADGPPATTTLRRGDAGNAGTLPAFDRDTTVRLVAASALDLGGVFGDESVRFELEPARWYIDYFLGACGLGQPPS